MTGQIYTSEVINQIIRTRRSVFTQQFEPSKVVPDEIIWEALENANWAPNHKFTEPWRFTVFTGNGLQKLAEQQADIYKKYAGAKFKRALRDSSRARSSPNVKQPIARQTSATNIDKKKLKPKTNEAASRRECSKCRAALTFRATPDSPQPT